MIAAWTAVFLVILRPWNRGTVIIWAALVGPAILLKGRRHIRQHRFDKESYRRASTPGCVPIAVPLVGLGGFPWLRRNEYGAIDMRQYTHEQWLSTGLPFCRTHMRDAGDVGFQTARDDQGRPYAVDPCTCGQIMNLERMAFYTQANRGQMVNTAVFLGVLAELSHHERTGRFSPAPLLEGYALVGINDQMKANKLREVQTSLNGHPELAGFWWTNKEAVRFYGAFALNPAPLQIHAHH